MYNCLQTNWGSSSALQTLQHYLVSMLQPEIDYYDIRALVMSQTHEPTLLVLHKCAYCASPECVHSGIITGYVALTCDAYQRKACFQILITVMLCCSLLRGFSSGRFPNSLKARRLGIFFTSSIPLHPHLFNQTLKIRRGTKNST